MAASRADRPSAPLMRLRAAAAQLTPLRRAVMALVVGVPVSALLLYLATRNLDLGQVGAALGDADPLLALLAVVAMGGVYALQAERWRLVARHEGTASRGTFLSMVVGSVAVNNVVPGRPGDVLRGLWVARRLDVPVTRGVATVIVDRATDVAVLAAALTISLPFVNHPQWLQTLYLSAMVLVAVIAATLALARRLARRGAAPWIVRIAERLRLARQAGDLVRAAAATVNARDLAVAGAVSALAWACWALAAFLVASSLGIALSLPELLALVALINLGVSVPSSPGFIGTYQWLGTATLGLFAVGQADAFAFSLILQAVWFVPTTLAGLAMAARLAVSWRPRPQAATQPLPGHAA